MQHQRIAVGKTHYEVAYTLMAGTVLFLGYCLYFPDYWIS